MEKKLWNKIGSAIEKFQAWESKPSPDEERKRPSKQNIRE
jgi:hypothetical protein